MLTGWHAVTLGLLQGLTEFLPISSSGHLVIGRALLGLEGPQLPFDILVHGATMAAILVYFRGRIWRIVREADVAYVGKLFVAMVPIVVIGGTFGRAIERAFGSPALVSVFLVVSGFGLASLYFVPRRGERWERGESEPGWWGALWIGVAQAAAILPGISRSGLTIVSGIWLGMAPAAAAEFSFLLGIPAIFGAVVYKYGVLYTAAHEGEGLALALGTAAAFLSGLLAIDIVFRLLAKQELRRFAYYCWVAALAFGLYMALTEGTA